MLTVNVALGAERVFRGAAENLRALACVFARRVPLGPLSRQAAKRSGRNAEGSTKSRSEVRGIRVAAGAGDLRDRLVSAQQPSLRFLHSQPGQSAKRRLSIGLLEQAEQVK